MTRTIPVQRGEMAIFEPVSLRWNDVDLYGHVNNAVYFQLFDSAMCKWMRRIRLIDGERSNIFVTASNSCEYLREVLFEDDVEVGFGIDRVGNSSVRYRIALFRMKDPDVLAQGNLVQVSVDRATRRPARLSPDEIALFTGILCASRAVAPATAD